jgi:hypothetical protein
MATPESKVKRTVSSILKEYGVYYEMPVPGGFGKSGLDYNCCVKGRWLSIETKSLGKKPTDRQQATIDAIRRSGGLALVVDGSDSTIERLRAILDKWTR